jgi:hypothetical protein
MVILTKDNIEEWKKELNEAIEMHLAHDGNYSDCKSDEEWLDDCIGQDAEEIALDEMSYGD